MFSIYGRQESLPIDIIFRQVFNHWDRLRKVFTAPAEIEIIMAPKQKTFQQRSYAT